jgi:hypothetical protein
MTDFHYMKLQHSESVVAQMAATVFAGLVQKGELGRQSEDELVERAVAIAIKLAGRTESLVKSDEEWQRKDSSSSYLIG